MGLVGVGAGCTVGKIGGIDYRAPGGQGWAVVSGGGIITVGALVAVNALGNVLAEDGSILAGATYPPARPAAYPFEVPIFPRSGGRWGADPEDDLQQDNTVIGCVVTDAVLTKPQAATVADLAHTGIARVIDPVHTRFDGDALFVLATQRVEVEAPIDLVTHLANQSVAAAIRAAVRAALPDSRIPALRGEILLVAVLHSRPCPRARPRPVADRRARRRGAVRGRASRGTDVSLATGQEAQGQSVTPLQVGAARVSLYPRPDLYQERFPGARWETNHALCATLSEATFTATGEDPNHGAHLATATANPWPENPDCLYMGGFGIGPMNPITTWDLAPGDPGFEESGLGTDGDATTGLGCGCARWRSATARTPGPDDPRRRGLVLGLRKKCTTAASSSSPSAWAKSPALDRPGHRDRLHPCPHRARLHRRLGLRAGLVHGAGLRGDPLHRREAVANQVPAILAYGETEAREFNGERRDTYRSAEEQNLTWLRASEPTQPGKTRSTIATLGAYAAHPVTADETPASPARLARPLRGRARAPLRRHRPALHDRAGQHVAPQSARRIGRQLPA